MVFVMSVLGYAGISFLLSALTVRIAPQSFTARQIRKQLVLFLVLPFLLATDLVAQCESGAEWLRTTARAAFEQLSGRQLYRSSTVYYGYGRQRSRGGNRVRKLERPVRTDRRRRKA